jgi:4-hydroxy-tetrahydrodipicolinate synthase
VKKIAGPRGVLSALYTPLTEKGEVDMDLLRRQVEYLSAGGPAGFFVLGTTAEGAYLSTENKRSIVEAVKQALPAEQIVCLALLQPTTDLVLAELRALEPLKPDYVVAVTPYYGVCGQADIRAHYEAIAEAASVPLILYNIPSRTQSPIALETVRGLTRHPNIVGIKDSSGGIADFSQGALGDYPEGFSWIMGDDYLQALALFAGGHGMVSGLSNVRIEPYVAMYQAAQKGDWDRVRSCQRIINQLHGVIHACGGNVNAGVKAGVAASGRGSHWMSLRSMSASKQQILEVEAVLRRVDALIERELR